MHSNPGHTIATASPLLTQVLERKRLLHRSQSKWKWALFNCIGAIVLIVEANGYSSLQPFVDSNSSWRLTVSRLEMLCVVVLLTNATLDTLHYFFPYLKLPTLNNIKDGTLNVAGKDLVLSPKQMSLFKINSDDPGFKVSTPNKPKDGDKEKHPFGFSPPIEGSFIASSPSGGGGGTSRHGVSFYNQSGYNSGDTTGGFIGANYSSVDSSSWYYHRPGGSPIYQNQVPHGGGVTGGGSTNQSRILPKFNSSVTENGAISDKSDLQIFLKEYDDWEKSISHNQTAAGMSNVSGMVILVFV